MPLLKNKWKKVIVSCDLPAIHVKRGKNKNIHIEIEADYIKALQKQGFFGAWLMIVYWRWINEEGSCRHLILNWFNNKNKLFSQSCGVLSCDGAQLSVGTLCKSADRCCLFLTRKVLAMFSEEKSMRVCVRMCVAKSMSRVNKVNRSDFKQHIYIWLQNDHSIAVLHMYALYDKIF